MKFAVRSAVLSAIYGFVFCAAAPTGAGAMTVFDADVASMTDHSEAVVQGEVIHIRSFFDSEFGEVMTDVEFRVEDAPKPGPVGKQTVHFLVPGGTYEGVDWDGLGFPKFRRGDRGVVFLVKIFENFGLYGLPQGVFHEKSAGAGAMLFQNLTDVHVIDPRDGIRIPQKPTYYELPQFKEYVRNQTAGRNFASNAAELTDMLHRSDAALLARTISVESCLSPSQKITSQIVLQRIEDVKTLSPDTVIIELDGGSTAEQAYVDHRYPVFEYGEIILLFLKRGERGMLPAGPAAKISARARSDGDYDLILNHQPAVKFREWKSSAR